jgi:hypothetical protein
MECGTGSRSMELGKILEINLVMELGKILEINLVFCLSKRLLYLRRYVF